MASPVNNNSGITKSINSVEPKNALPHQAQSESTDEHTIGIPGTEACSSSIAEVVNRLGVDSLSSPDVNIPKDDNNYHWFLPDFTNNKLTISPSSTVSLATAIGGTRIRVGMSIKKMVNRILSHIGH